MATILKASHAQTRQHNRNLVLSLIVHNDSISRAELARQTGLTRATVSELAAELIQAGLVHEVGVGRSHGGKSPILLSLEPDSRYLIGLDLAYDGFRAAVLNLRGAIKHSVRIPAGVLEGEQALDQIFELLDELAGGEYRPLAGMGIGTPGLVHYADGVVVSAINLGWKNLPLRRILEERYQIPVVVMNDSQAAAVGEYTYRSQRVDSLIAINARQGLGAGMVLGGRLYTGDSGGAGEIGHMVVEPVNGKLCRCGNHGCLETVASTPALANQARAFHPEPVYEGLNGGSDKQWFDVLVQAYQAGEPQALSLVQQTAAYLSLAIGAVTSAMNVHEVVITGDLRRFGSTFLDAVRTGLQDRALPQLAQDTRISAGTLGEDSILLGAAAALSSEYSRLFFAS